MYRVSGCVSVLAMLYALVFAPLYHVHDHDDHGHAGSFAHAHFFESETPSDHTAPAFEESESHAHVRWIDVFTVNTAAKNSFHAVAEFSEPVSIPIRNSSRSVISMQTLRAHSPPKYFNVVPRAPPSL